MQFIDTHAHVNFNAFKDDGEEILQRSLKEGVFIINVGSQYSTSQRAVEYAHKFDGVYAAIGIHPIHLNKKTVHIDSDELDSALEIKSNGEEYDVEKYIELAKDKKVVAIGEVGLDYHHFEENEDNIEELKKKQKKVLIQFIELANLVNKPVMLHCWDAYDDLLEILKKHPINKKGIVHSFIGSYKTANEFIELGYKIGLNGIVTYGESYDRLIKEIALEDIVIETDCPYLTPRPLKRGARNEPLFVKHVAEKIATVKGISVEDVAEITTKNAKLLLNIM